MVTRRTQSTVTTNNNSTMLNETFVFFKTILVGDSGVGKTSILVQFDQGKFQSGSFSATVGIGFTVSWKLFSFFLFCFLTNGKHRRATAIIWKYEVFLVLTTTWQRTSKAQKQPASHPAGLYVVSRVSFLRVVFVLLLIAVL